MEVKIVHVGDIEWSKPEWADDDSQALTVIASGYELEIGQNVEDPKKWDWSCRMTAEISETPELVDCGTAASVSGAKRAAGTAANNDQRRRAKANAEARTKAQEPEEPEPQDAGEMLDGVEQQLAEAMKPAKTPEPAAA